MQKGFFQNQAQNCSAFFKKKLGDNGNPIVKLFTETYLSKKVCCFIFHSSNATVQKLLQWNLDLRKPDLRKNLDLRKIVGTTDFLVHKLFDLRNIF